MSWTDKQAVKVIKHLRDKYKVKCLVETGTYMGINARLHSKNFNFVLTIEKIKEYYQKATSNLYPYLNVGLVNESSPEVLRNLPSRKHKKIFYLDAHFYDPKLPKKKRFVILDELKALKKQKNAIIIIHDFDNGLGHITYDGIPLNLDLIRKPLFKINKNFHLYTNTLDSCDIVKPTIESIKEAGLIVDEHTLGNLEYAHQTPRLTFRGILYCLPTKLSPQEMDLLGLRTI